MIYKCQELGGCKIAIILTSHNVYMVNVFIVSMIVLKILEIAYLTFNVMGNTTRPCPPDASHLRCLAVVES